MCTDTAGYVPTWFLNGSVVVGDDYSYSIDENSGVVTAPINTPNEAHAIGLHFTGFLGEFRGGGRGKLMTEVTRRIT